MKVVVVRNATAAVVRNATRGRVHPEERPPEEGHEAQAKVDEPHRTDDEARAAIMSALRREGRKEEEEAG